MPRLRCALLDTWHSGSAFVLDAGGERGIPFQHSELASLVERSEGRQRPTFPEGSENFPLTRARGEARQ